MKNKYLLILSCLFLTACSLEYMPGYRFDLFKDTPNYDLALAVRKNNVAKLEELLNSKVYNLELKENKYGQSILELAIANKKLKAAKVLIKHGANVDATNKRGLTILMSEMEEFFNMKMVKFLVENGANVNAVSDSAHTSPLLEAVSCGSFKNVKYLIDKGADPNMWVKYEGNSPFNAALTREGMNVAKYLLIEKKVKVILTWQYPNSKRIETLASNLKGKIFPLGSKRHKTKMEIVKYLVDNYGMDYENAPIGKYLLISIQQLHPNDWQEYIKKY